MVSINWMYPPDQTGREATKLDVNLGGSNDWNDESNGVNVAKCIHGVRVGLGCLDMGSLQNDV